MARAEASAEELLNAVLAQAVTPPLKGAGFRKSGRNYHRRHGETVQVVNVQLSRASSWSGKEFFINVGIAFDALCELNGRPVLERPTEANCDFRGTRDRLESLIPGAPASWVVRAGQKTVGFVAELRVLIEQLVSELDPIDGPAAYRSHRWFDRFRPVQENAQILYLLSDMAGAWREIQDLATLFSDGQNANSAAWWVEYLRLSGLETDLTR